MLFKSLALAATLLFSIGLAQADEAAIRKVMGEKFPEAKNRFGPKNAV